MSPGQIALFCLQWIYQVETYEYTRYEYTYEYTYEYPYEYTR